MKAWIKNDKLRFEHDYRNCVAWTCTENTDEILAHEEAVLDVSMEDMLSRLRTTDDSGVSNVFSSADCGRCGIFGYSEKNPEEFVVVSPQPYGVLQTWTELKLWLDAHPGVQYRLFPCFEQKLRHHDGSPSQLYRSGRVVIDKHYLMVRESRNAQTVFVKDTARLDRLISLRKNKQDRIDADVSMASRLGLHDKLTKLDDAITVAVNKWLKQDKTRHGVSFRSMLTTVDAKHAITEWDVFQQLILIRSMCRPGLYRTVLTALRPKARELWSTLQSVRYGGRHFNNQSLWQGLKTYACAEEGLAEFFKFKRQTTAKTFKSQLQALKQINPDTLPERSWKTIMRES